MSFGKFEAACDTQPILPYSFLDVGSLTEQGNLPGTRAEFSQDGQQEGGFTATVWSNNTDKFTPLNSKIDALEHRVARAIDRKISDIEHGYRLALRWQRGPSGVTPGLIG